MIIYEGHHSIHRLSCHHLSTGQRAGAGAGAGLVPVGRSDWSDNSSMHVGGGACKPACKTLFPEIAKSRIYQKKRKKKKTDGGLSLRASHATCFPSSGSHWPSTRRRGAR